ncbi:MAG: ribosome silencing factor [bacterium]|jgi:ribosome-associated protein|nr:ribosome silencing factor [bacterium]
MRIRGTEPIPTQLDYEQLAREAAKALDDAKGLEVTILHLGTISSFADYFVIATADNPIHLRALTDRVRERMAQIGAKISGAEGRESKTWVLLDYGPILIHLFSRKARVYYGLEQLWGDSKVIPWNEPPILASTE